MMHRFCAYLHTHHHIRHGLLVMLSVGVIFAVGVYVHGEIARALDKVFDGIMVGIAEAMFKDA